MSSLRLDHVFSSLYLAKSRNARGHGQQEQAAEGLMFSPPTPWPLPRKFDSPRQKRGYTKMYPGNHLSAPKHGCHHNNLVLVVHLTLSCSKQLLLSLDPGPEEAGAHQRIHIAVWLRCKRLRVCLGLCRSGPHITVVVL